MPANRAVTIKAIFQGGKQILSETEAAGRGIRGLGTAAKDSGVAAAKGSGGWFTLSKAQTEHVKGHSRLLSGLNNVRSKVGIYAAGITGIYGAKSIVDSTMELTHSALKFQAMSGMSMQGAMKYTEAFKALGVGSEAGATAYRFLAKNAQTAEKQEKKFAESNRISAISLEKKRMALAKAEDSGNAYAIQSARMALNSQSASKEIGAQAKAFNDLGINVREWMKLKPDDQFKVIIQRLSAMPAGLQRSADMSRLLGRGGASLAFAFNKGAFSLQNLAEKAGVLLPHMANTQKSVEATRQAGAEATIAWDSLKLSIGMKLLPILAKVAQHFQKIAMQIKEHKGFWGALATMVETAAKAFGVAIGWIKKNQVAFDLLKYVIVAGVVVMAGGKLKRMFEDVKKDFKDLYILMKANPWMVLAMLVIFVAIEIIQHWGAVKKFFEGAWTKIKEGAEIAWNWIKHNWPYLAAMLIGPWAVAVLWVIKHWGKVVEFFKGLAKGIVGVFEGIGSAIANVFKWIVNNTIIAYINGVLHLIHVLYKKIPDPLGILPAWPLADPAIPRMARGGVVHRHGAALVGEQGPEILNLPVGARVSPLDHKGGGLMGAFQGESSGDLHVHIELDKREIGIAVMREFRRLAARA